jgi:hypothetical protein
MLLALILERFTLFSESNPNLQTYFKEYIGFSHDQVAATRSGQAVAKTRGSRAQAEILMFGAIYVNAGPES